ncbi:MAG: amidohydrolase family protein [Alphaproteobacteria bacterium]
MVSFPIVDTHLHIWDTRVLDYPWLAEQPALNRPFLPRDYDIARGEVAVDKMVFLECDVEPTRYLDEADWVAAEAREDHRIEGMVAHAPLEKGAAVEPDLERLRDHAILRGVRRLIQQESDPEFCLRPDFIAAIKLLPKFDLSFDICIYHPQLASVVELVRRCPEVRFILDHVGKPNIKDGVLEPWRAEIGELAAMPNVHCKVSGMVTEADHESWTRDDLRPYIDHVIECFGFDRVVYGGDWPVSTLATTYPRWVETLEWAVSGSSEEELRKLFRDNAIRFYRLS